MKLMLSKRYYNLQRQQQPTILAKGNSSFKRLEKSMKEAPKEYDQIKKLVEDASAGSASIRDKNEHIINNIDLKNSNINPTKNVKIMLNRKINNKSKK
jgi:hypothetical protein